MARRRGTVLVDTNVKAHRTSSWQALTGGYAVATVTDCVREIQTSLQRRRPERQINETRLGDRLASVHEVGDLERAVFVIRAGAISLDRGETLLWAHALGRDDDWVLCGPDKASLRCGVILGLRKRLVSMEGLLDEVSHRPGTGLREPYTKQWHDRTLGRLVLAERC